jgi:hypothetical protein
MYVVNIVDHIHHLLNELKKSKFAYNNDQKEYVRIVQMHVELDNEFKEVVVTSIKLWYQCDFVKFIQHTIILCVDTWFYSLKKYGTYE